MRIGDYLSGNRNTKNGVCHFFLSVFSFVSLHSYFSWFAARLRDRFLVLCLCCLSCSSLLYFHRPDSTLTSVAIVDSLGHLQSISFDHVRQGQTKRKIGVPDM